MLLGREVISVPKASSAVEPTAVEETWAQAAVYFLNEKTVLGAVGQERLLWKRKTRRMSPTQMLSGKVSISFLVDRRKKYW